MSQGELFNKERRSENKKGWVPLAERLRPIDFSEFVGQNELVAIGTPLRSIIESGNISSMVFWGPPGSGKTSLARIIANMHKFDFVQFSATSAGVQDVRTVIEKAKYNKSHLNKKTILFVDEIHRFNKSQQDTFLPFIEDGTIVLIGATTENPSFELNSSLLSRCKVFVLKQLTQEELKIIMMRAIEDKERGLGEFKLSVSDEILDFISRIVNGDARAALNILELSANSVISRKNPEITLKDVEQVVQRKSFLYDKSGEEHYNLISAFHKSLRGGDVDASLYWLARMLESGEDPLFIARRLVRAASEDVGLADPQALLIAIAAKEAVDFIGMPECDLALAQATVYIALAPKSNSLYSAMAEAKEDVLNKPNLPVPLEIRNPVTDLMKELGYGKGYKYPHSSPTGVVKQQYLPDNLLNAQYYHPKDSGFEIELKKRLEMWKKLRMSV